ncbi:MAG: GNAT family N-acetyltransferase [Candidatus Berkiellales bacterium]
MTYQKNLNITSQEMILIEGLLPQYRFIQAFSPNESDAYDRIISNEIFSSVGENYDPIKWRKLDENIFYFVFLLGNNAIGAARIEFTYLPAKQAILRFIAIDKLHQNQGHGKHLLKYIIEWVSQQGARKLFLHAIVHATDFYRKSGFVEMSFDDPRRLLDSPVVDLGMTLQ